MQKNQGKTDENRGRASEEETIKKTTCKKTNIEKKL